jgi:hypothetical protein
MTAETTTDWGPLARPVHETVPVDRAVLGDKPWRDNAYIAFWDPASDLFGSVHVSTSPNAPGRRARCSIVLDGRVTEIVEELPPGTFRSASIDFDLAGSRIGVDSPQISAELHLAPRFVPADYSATGLIPELIEGVPLRHHQQGVVLTGELTVSGARTTVRAEGLRDRTWGPRDESSVWPEYAAVAACLPEFDLSVMAFRGLDGSRRAHGFLMAADGAEVVTDATFTRDACGLIDGLSFVTESGRERSLTMRSARGGVWVPSGAGFSEQGVMRYT